MKSLWYKFINWLIPNTRKEENPTTVEYSSKPKNPKEPPRLIDNDRLEQHMNLDLSYSIEGGKITPLDLAEVENIARTEGITLDQAASQLSNVYQSGNDPITTTHLYTLDEGEEVVSLKRDKMQKLIDQKKNRKPFYKDNNKKDWE